MRLDLFMRIQFFQPLLLGCHILKMVSYSSFLGKWGKCKTHFIIKLLFCENIKVCSGGAKSPISEQQDSIYQSGANIMALPSLTDNRFHCKFREHTDVLFKMMFLILTFHKTWCHNIISSLCESIFMSAPEIVLSCYKICPWPTKERLLEETHTEWCDGEVTEPKVRLSWVYVWGVWMCFQVCLTN